MARPFGLLLLALSISAVPARALAAPQDASPTPDAGPQTQPAQPHGDTVERVEDLLSEGEFEQAVQALNARLDDPTVPDAELVELYRLLGLAQLYVGNEAAARDAYEKLLQAQPEYELPRTAPPKIRELYARIKADIRERFVAPVTIILHSIDAHPGGQPLTVFAKVTDAPLGAQPKLHYRHRGAKVYSSVAFAREPTVKETFTARIPAFDLRLEGAPYGVEYYIEVTDASGRLLAAEGSATAPRRFTVTAGDGIRDPGAAAAEAGAKAWYKRPWVWVVTGVVVAGAAATVIVVTRKPPDGQ